MSFACAGSTVLLGPGIGPLMGYSPPPLPPVPIEAAPFVFFADECIVRLSSWTGSLTDVRPFVPINPLPYGDRK